MLGTKRSRLDANAASSNELSSCLAFAPLARADRERSARRFQNEKNDRPTEKLDVCEPRSFAGIPVLRTNPITTGEIRKFAPKSACDTCEGRSTSRGHPGLGGPSELRICAFFTCPTLALALVSFCAFRKSRACRRLRKFLSGCVISARIDCERVSENQTCLVD